MDTRGYGGRRFNDGVRVSTNDPARAEFTLTVSGQVERFAEIVPNRLTLAGRAGEPLKGTVTIRQTAQFPFEIRGIRARRGEHLQMQLDHSQNGPLREYVLTVENTKDTPGRYIDQIYLQTDSDLNPELRIGVSVFIRPGASGGGS